LAALFSTPFALIGAALAMLDLMFPALSTAGIAYFSAQATELLREL
jgi:hypothetical protein